MTGQEEVLAGGGEMGERMRALDWSQTPLGPVEGWPTTLRTTVALMLVAPSPMVILWGPELRLLYNDGHIPLFGDKHPKTLGASFFDLFPELRDGLSPLFDQVWAGTAVSQKEGLLCLERQGFMEEVYFTLSFLPIRDERGRVVGILDIVSEVTAQVLGARHLKTLRELSIQSALSPGVQDVLHQVQGVLAQSGADVPFALLYRVEGEHARRVLCSGLEAGGSRSPQTLALSDPHSPWPLAEVLDSGQTRLVEGLGVRGGALHAGPWPEPVTRALLLPLALGTSGARDAVLIVGLSPRLPVDGGYRDFLQVLARQLAADVVRAQALEQETQRAARLAEMDRVKTAFFSNVSHEFRTPLTLMLGPLENALASPGQGLRGEELQRVHRNALRLLKLVNTLLDLSRLEAGRTQGRFKPTDLAPLTAGLASAFDSVMTRAGLCLVVDCPPLPEPVWVDPDLWEKVVLNLVSNAFKYTLAGEVAVRLKWRGERVELSVQDTGTGIPLEQQGHLFERFYRVEGARGRSDEGTGIGLSLVRELVELHGGSVRVESTPGQGSTFTVSLPTGQTHLPPERVLHEPPRVSTATGSQAFLKEAEQWLEPGEQEAEALAAGVPAGQTLLGQVLLADDNADMRDYMARLLRTRFRVEAVADGLAALEAARARPPDVVLSDVMMPRLDGFGLARALKADARTAHLSILLISARASEKATLEGFAAGGVDYLVKPFRAKELLARVEAAVRAAQARSEKERLLQEVQAARERAESLAKQLRGRVDFEQQLMGIVSHDLRNPLSAILLGTTLMAKREDLDARATKSLVRIQSAAERATRMVKDLLDFTQARLGGGLKIEPHPMDLHGVTRSVLDEVEVAWPTRQLEVRHEGNGEGSWDADRVAQVVQNLVTNALKYSPEDSRVHVFTREEAGGVCLSVLNKGKPIPPDKLTSIFEPMQRATAEIDKTGRSVGLGLYIVKRIVDAHGGRVAVASTEAEGTVFTVHLPRQQV